MSYATSTQDGRVRELYQFVRDGETYRYTSAAQDITAMGETWPASSISRNAIEQGQDIARASLNLTMPRTDGFARQYLLPWIETTTSLTIYSELDDDDWGVMWKGRVSGGSLSGGMIEIECESVLTSSARMGLGARVTRNCGHAVYHRGCNLDKADFAVFGVVTAANGVTLTVPKAAEQADGEYLGGMVEWNGVIRWILSHVGDQLVITSPFRDIDEALLNPGWNLYWNQNWNGVLGVILYPGCDRSKERCNTRFHNIENRRAFDGMPRRSPFDGSSIV